MQGRRAKEKERAEYSKSRAQTSVKSIGENIMLARIVTEIFISNWTVWQGRQPHDFSIEPSNNWDGSRLNSVSQTPVQRRIKNIKAKKSRKKDLENEAAQQYEKNNGSIRAID